MLLFCGTMKLFKTVILILCLTLADCLALFAGTVDTLNIISESMRKEVKCIVILPENYSSVTNRFPVLYLLHGYSGNYSSWLKLDPGLPEKVDKLNMIIVCPDGGYGSWYIDSPIDSTMKYETHIVEEIIPFIDMNYRTIDRKDQRAITGLSMGGHGGLYLAARHTDVFGAAGSSSGGVDIRQYTESWELKERILGDTICCKQNWEDHTVINVIEKLENNQLKLIIDCGIDDFFLDVNRKLHEKLLKNGIDHDYTERPGKHNSEYWLNSIDYHLLFFEKFFNSSTIGKQ